MIIDFLFLSLKDQ